MSFPTTKLYLEAPRQKSWYDDFIPEGVKILMGTSDSMRKHIEINNTAAQLGPKRAVHDPKNDPMVKVLRYGTITVLALSAIRYAYANHTGEVTTIKDLYKARFGKELAIWDHLGHVDGPSPEGISLERRYEDDRNRESYERVQEGSASERDYERAAQWERDHLS